MTDIRFAKEHMGEYFQLKGRKVRVIGYDVSGAGYCVIVDDMKGWPIEAVDSTDRIIKNMCETGRCWYVKWEDLR